jgi:hypothetical protein
MTDSPTTNVAVDAELAHLGETGPLSQGLQAGRKALRTRHINGMEVRKKRPRGSSEPREPPISFSLLLTPPSATGVRKVKLSLQAAPLPPDLMRYV